MNLLSKLLPHDSKFFPLFEQIAGNFRLARRVLDDFADSPPGETRSTLARRMKEVEHENDVVTHRIYDQLHKTFITPFDREDIHQLASAADDVIDYLCSAIERCDVLHIDALTAEMKEQIRILSESMEIIAGILASLADLKRHGKLDEDLKELHTLENDADATYTRALAKLFADTSDPIDVIRWNDVYRTVERAIDRCEHVANVTEGIAIKHA